MTRKKLGGDTPQRCLQLVYKNKNGEFKIDYINFGIESGFFGHLRIIIQWLTARRHSRYQ